MRQKDISLIILVAGISALVSFMLSKTIFRLDDSKKQKVEIVDPITTTFTEPDKRYFNPQAYNPTQLIQIKDNNSKPFN